jgi:hypothetical protein
MVRLSGLFVHFSDRLSWLAKSFFLILPNAGTILNIPLTIPIKADTSHPSRRIYSPHVVVNQSPYFEYQYCYITS